MGRANTLKPVYVQYIPPADMIKEGELYISLEFHTAVHKCCCGCGKEVVTPFNPAQWRLLDKGGKVSICPSIGNWSYPCKSHYFIENNSVLWAEMYSAAAIKLVQESDKRAFDKYISRKNPAPQSPNGPQKFFAVLRALANIVRDLLTGK